jgi:hypothetical protein
VRVILNAGQIPPGCCKTFGEILRAIYWSRERSVMPKGKQRQNKDREEPIAMGIVVDASGPEEQAVGWRYEIHRF